MSNKYNRYNSDHLLGYNPETLSAEDYQAHLSICGSESAGSQSEMSAEYDGMGAPFDHETMLGMGYAYNHEDDMYELVHDHEGDEVASDSNSAGWSNYVPQNQQSFSWGASDSNSAKKNPFRKQANKRTSDTHPLDPSYIPASAGHMGLVICPSKQGGGMVGMHERDFDKDMTRLAEQGVDKIYGLMPKYELVQYKAERLLSETGTYGVEYVYCGWTDRETPDNPDFEACVDMAVQDLKDGLRIVVHCRGGLGRTGTFAGCVLARLGWHVDQMIDMLHEARGYMCPETEEQTAFIRSVCVAEMLKRNDIRKINDRSARAIYEALSFSK